MTRKRVRLATFNGVIECWPSSTFADFYVTPPQQQPPPKEPEPAEHEESP